MIRLYMYLIDVCRLLVSGWLPSYSINEVNIVGRPDYLHKSCTESCELCLIPNRWKRKGMWCPDERSCSEYCLISGNSTMLYQQFTWEIYVTWFCWTRLESLMLPSNSWRWGRCIPSWRIAALHPQSPCHFTWHLQRMSHRPWGPPTSVTWL
jgi:hypothetical protein